MNRVLDSMIVATATITPRMTMNPMSLGTSRGRMIDDASTKNMTNETSRTSFLTVGLTSV